MSKTLYANELSNVTAIFCLGWLLGAVPASLAGAAERDSASRRPNILFILTDDHRADVWSAAGNPLAHTPNLDRIAERGTRFDNAFVTLAICSPSRAACLTGQYGSVNGVTAVGRQRLKDPNATFAHALQKSDYQTGVTGKWHLKENPAQCGFDFWSVCLSNGTWYDRKFDVNGESKVMPGFVDDVTADESIRFMRQAEAVGKPFMLWLNTQVPHMDDQHTWPVEEAILRKYEADQMPLPITWNDELQGKPEYLKTSRYRTQALEYGYADPTKMRQHVRDYYASVEQMDKAVGRVLDELARAQILDDTWIFVMGDNGWFLGEHGLTSKVLAYEESMRVPLAIAGPQAKAQLCDELVLNIDLTATIFEIAQLQIPSSIHGRSLLGLVSGNPPSDWRKCFLYEAPTSQLGSQPLWAVRDKHWKYIATELADGEAFEELYDLQVDRIEATNVADVPANAATVRRLREELQRQRAALAAAPGKSAGQQGQ